MEIVSEGKQWWLLMQAGNEMIMPHRWSSCQGVADLGSLQPFFALWEGLLLTATMVALKCKTQIQKKKLKNSQP